MNDAEILEGLVGDPKRRQIFEHALYSQYVYLINQGMKKHLSYEDSFSIYSDTVMTFIHSVHSEIFERRSSIKTYLTRIFLNKCVDTIRKNTSVKGKVNRSGSSPDILSQMPDPAKSAVEILIRNQLIDELRKNFEYIGEKCKEILMLYQDNIKDHEIADILGYNSASVAKVTRLRCLHKLKEKMKGLSF